MKRLRAKKLRAKSAECVTESPRGGAAPTRVGPSGELTMDGAAEANPNGPVGAKGRKGGGNDKREGGKGKGWL